jgi:uncharacterized protein YciI
VTAPTELDRYTLVLLRRPSDAPDLPEAELDRLQEAHLAHLDSLREHGLLVAGPFLGQEDDSLRGMCLFHGPAEQVRELMAADPSVQAGRLRPDVLTWLTRKGALRLGESGSS